MIRHGLCVQESSQGKCFSDGKRCGWRIVGCFFDWLWKPIQITILLLGFALFVWLLLSITNKPKALGNAQNAVLVTVTAYSPTVEECDDTPLVTAFQKRVKEGIVAISRDMEEKHGWREGDLIHIEGIGVFEVGDRMNRRWKERVDIFFFKTQEARAFGKIKARAVKL